jgi:tRNA (guanine9-N1)-methyltransferase
MEAEERPSKMRKLNDDDAEAQAPTAQLSSEPVAQRKETDGASSQGEPDDNDADTADSSDGGVAIKAEKAPQPEGLSKNAWKKLQKKADWEAGREYRKAKRKQKIQEKKERTRTAKAEARAQSTTPSTTNGNTAKTRIRHKRLPVTFLIDCGFDDLMTEKERISLGSQLTRSYSDNIRAPFQAHIVVSSWGGLLKERFDTVLEKHHENWRGVVFSDKGFEEAAERAKEVMKGPYGGEMAGIFSRYSLAEQPEIGSGKIRAQPDLSVRAIEGQPELNSIVPYEAGSLFPASVEGSDQSASQATDQKPAGQIEHSSIEDPTSSSPVPDLSANLGVDRASQQGGNTSLLSNGSPFANGQRPAPSVDHSHPSNGVSDTDQGEVIYLTSDSPYTLDELKPYSTYIIGGLVDKNRHKGICYQTACEKGLKTAKLPIGEFMEMQSRFVLATNHVVEIMVRWLECGDWGKAFLDVIPKRKGGKLKDTEAPEGLDEHDV